MRGIVCAVGVGLGVASVVVTSLAACSCDNPSPPVMSSCDRASAGAVSAIEIQRVEEIHGTQGGTHLEVDVRVVGSALGACIAQRTELRGPSGVVETNASNVPLRGSDTDATSAPILLFPPTAPSISDVPLTLVVEIGGRTAARELETLAQDGGP
ncbi:hypothetical protein [Sandaracinus amylolyticus]|uniref:Lipoprotein n=1 Tax=Sandaracinus amylolyticus TaxID=927083 RepID=A0A0F6W587_9BACT|nr:hypothetical protein [Sandaracinus amylolyticus]AKF07748.1 hypothetical protein DB32_004897 [Sandaracinus amylolyticus]